MEIDEEVFLEKNSVKETKNEVKKKNELIFYFCTNCSSNNHVDDFT